MIDNKNMVTEISNWTWEAGSRKEVDRLEIPSILHKMNSILEWDYCKFPPLGKEASPDDPDKENREFLGTPPEMKVGTVFKLGNQLLAIDSEDAIVMITSETGAFGLRRIWEDIISPEINLAFNIDGPEKLDFEKVEASEIPDTWEDYKIPYSQAKIWRDRFLPGRPEYPEKGLVLKATLVSDSFVFPIHLFIQDWRITYDPMEMEEDELKMCTNEVIKWFYDNFPRKDFPMEIKRAEAEKKEHVDSLKGLLEQIKSFGADPNQQQNP